MKAWSLFCAYLLQIALAVDQLINALIPPLTGTVSMADETLSARCYRAWRDGRAWGRLLLPVIDFLFLWQTKEHCRHAYMKELQRRNLPREYR